MNKEQFFNSPNLFPNKPEIPRIIIEVFGSYDNFYKKVQEYYQASEEGGYKAGTDSFYRQIIGGIKVSRDYWKECVEIIDEAVEELKTREEELKERNEPDRTTEAHESQAEEEKRRTGLTDDYEEFKE